MSPEDHALLGQIRIGLAEPFADPVRVGAVTLSRATARALERQMLRLRVAERHSIPPVHAANLHRRDTAHLVHVRGPSSRGINQVLRPGSADSFQHDLDEHADALGSVQSLSFHSAEVTCA